MILKLFLSLLPCRHISLSWDVYLSCTNAIRIVSLSRNFVFKVTVTEITSNLQSTILGNHRLFEQVLSGKIWQYTSHRERVPLLITSFYLCRVVHGCKKIFGLCECSSRYQHHSLPELLKALDFAKVAEPKVKNVSIDKVFKTFSYIIGFTKAFTKLTFQKKERSHTLRQLITQCTILYK